MFMAASSSSIEKDLDGETAVSADDSDALDMSAGAVALEGDARIIYQNNKSGCNGRDAAAAGAQSL